MLQISCCKTCIPEAKLFLIMFRIHGLVKIVCNFVFSTFVESGFDYFV